MRFLYAYREKTGAKADGRGGGGVEEVAGSRTERMFAEYKA